MSNDSIYGKFRQRIKNIKLIRIKKQGENKEFIEDKVRIIKKSFQGQVVIVRTGKGISKIDDKKKSVGENRINTVKEKIANNVVKDSTDKSIIRVKKDDKFVRVIYPDKGIKDSKLVEKDNKIVGKEVDVENKFFSEEKKEFISKREDVYHTRLGNNGIVNAKDKEVRDTKYSYLKKRNLGLDKNLDKEAIDEFRAEIIEKIKSSFEDKLDELEVLESELFLLNDKDDREVELKKVKEIKDKINELIVKINEIIEQYNLYSKNYYLDNLVGIDDNVIVDDIIDYRNLLDSMGDEKEFVHEFKNLEEFKNLYSSLIEIKSDTEQLVQENEDKIEEFGIRDKKYDDIKLGMVQACDTQKQCSLEIDRQNEYLANLMGKIEEIDSREYITYRMKGIGDLLGQTLSYMGLMLVSPLRGLIPGIATSTIATRRMIKNVINHLHLEKVEKVKYQTIDYDSELNHKLTSIEYTDNMLDDTIRDVQRLKEDFMMQYDSRIPGYEDSLKRIYDIEELLFRNQRMVFIVKNRLKASKKINEDKLIKVKKLNEDRK